MNKDIYLYDEARCTYVRRRPTLLGFLFANAFFILLAGFLASGFVLLWLWLFPTQRVQQLQTEQRKLATYDQRTQQDISQFVHQLADLKVRKANLHKLITDSDEEPQVSAKSRQATRILIAEQMRLEALSELVTAQRISAARTVQQKQLLLELMQKEAHTLASRPTGVPLEQLDLICGFGEKNSSYAPGLRHHDGVDLNAPMNSPVLATAPGVVYFAGKQAGAGNTVQISHGNGYVTAYRHLNKINVRKGQPVRLGQQIGLTGNSGLVRGPHLHYSILRDGVAVNPLPYMVATLPPSLAVPLRETAQQSVKSME